MIVLVNLSPKHFLTLTFQKLRDDAICIKNKKKIKVFIQQTHGIETKFRFKNIQNGPQPHSKNRFFQRFFLDQVWLNQFLLGDILTNPFINDVCQILIWQIIWNCIFDLFISTKRQKKGQMMWTTFMNYGLILGKLNHIQFVLQGYFGDTHWWAWKPGEATLTEGVGFIPRKTFDSIKTRVREKDLSQKGSLSGLLDQLASDDQRAEIENHLKALQNVLKSMDILSVQDKNKSKETIADLPRTLN